MYHIVRIWLDLKIDTDDAETAKHIADKIPINIGKDKEGYNVELYDSQVADMWTKNNG